MVSLKCTSAYTSDLYDTPSGHLQPDYVLASEAASTSLKVANVIGSQSWLNCHDDKGGTYELKITPAEYAGFGQTGGRMPLESIDQVEADKYRI
jgi:hypothetical protein